MVKSLNRWLALLAICVSVSFVPHPLHVSVAEINHNSAEKTLEISCKLFTDDFESILAKTYNAKVDLSHPADKTAMDKLVDDYIHHHFSVKLNDKAAAYSFVGFEKEEDATYCFFQVDNVPMVKKIAIHNNLMYEMYTDQVNIIHVIVGGKRKSNKLDYPASEVSVDF